MIKLCIFDLDGTLLNTAGALARVTNMMLSDLNAGSITENDAKVIVGDGYRKQVERALKLNNTYTEENFTAGCEIYMSYFKDHCMDTVHPYDGIPELIKELRNRGIKTAVLSNKPDAQTKEHIERFFEEGDFDLVYGERAGIPKKPAPDGVYEILKEMDVKPEECLYLGDTNTDMKTGTGAGLVTLGVLWGFRGREELESFGPAGIIETPDACLNYL